MQSWFASGFLQQHGGLALFKRARSGQRHLGRRIMQRLNQHRQRFFVSDGA